MGASGNLATINLKEHSFEKIKEEMTYEIYYWLGFNLIGVEGYDIFDEVEKMNNINEFIKFFNSKIVSYCPKESGIYISGVFYNDWSDEIMPQIVDNHLVLYETDQQMQYQNYPVWMLSKLIEQNVEIWT